MTGAGFLAFAAQLSLGIDPDRAGGGLCAAGQGAILADRVVALDMMTITIIAFCGVYAVFMDEPSFLDVAIVLALVGLFGHSGAGALCRTAFRTG
jgi:multicomponent Na+:H+ antiporter subunit F